MKNVSGAIVFQMRQGHPFFLLLQDIQSGFWQFPQGSNHPEESFVESANRSIIEETGLKISVNSDFVNVTSDENTQITLFIVEANLNVHVKLNVERNSTMGWFDYVTAKQRLALISQKEALNAASNFIEKSL